MVKLERKSKLLVSKQNLNKLKISNNYVQIEKKIVEVEYVHLLKGVKINFSNWFEINSPIFCIYFSRLSIIIIKDDPILREY